MNIVLYDKSELHPDGTLYISDFRFDHIKTVLKKSHEETIRVGEREGLMGEAAIIAIDDSGITLKPNLTEQPPAPLPVTLVVAMSRPKSFRKLLHTATVMGVKEVYVIKTWRVDKSYWQTPFLSEKGLDDIILDGLMQTRDTIAPKVYLRKAFKPFVEDELPGIIANREARVFHPVGETVPFTVEQDQNYCFIIGPEGGFIPYEVEQLVNAGALHTSLGNRIQRVEQAVASVLGYTSMSLL